MDPEKKDPNSFDAEDTGDLEIPVEMQKAAQAAFIAQHGADAFDPEQTSEFLSKDQTLNSRDDQLAAERRQDLERLAPIISDKSDAFHRKTLDERDHLAEKRMNQYEIEKEYNSAPQADFYEKTGLSPEEQEAERLTEQQRILLNTVTKLTDGVGFDEVHPDLQRAETLRPTSAPMDGVRYREEPAEELPPTPLEMADQVDGATVQANMTFSKYQVLTGERESSDLLGRERAPHPVATVDRDSLLRRGKPMSTEMMVAIGLVLLAVPLFGWSIYNQTHTNAESDRIQSEQAAALATETADKHSMANQMEEPFRMPAGQTGPLGGGSYAHVEQENNGRNAQGELANWKPPAHPTPAPTGEQLEANRKILAQADQMEALGNTTQAAYLLNAALAHCPGDINLVIAAARKYMALKDYGTARNILKGAMSGARTLGDYGLLLQVLNQIPGG